MAITGINVFCFFFGWHAREFKFEGYDHQELLEHLGEKHKQGMLIECPTCHFTDSKQAVIIHIISQHTGEAAYPCALCNVKFCFLPHRNEHQLICRLKHKS